MNYLIYGTSYHLIDIEIKKILGNKKYETKFLEDISIKDIVEDLNYSSMFDDEKTIVIKNAELIFDKDYSNKEEDINSLSEYLANPNKLTTLILICSTKISERSKKAKEFLSHFKVINTPTVTKQFELAKLMDELIRKDGYAISQNALNKFAIKCALSIDVAIMEFDKLKTFKNDNKLISEKDIEEYVSNYNTSDIFEFKDAIINKNIGEALRLLDDLETSKIELIPLIVMLAKEFITIYNVKFLVEKKHNNDLISTKLGNMHPYRVKLLRETGNKYSLDELKKIILYLCNLDIKMVTKDNLGFDELRQFIILL